MQIAEPICKLPLLHHCNNSYSNGRRFTSPDLTHNYLSQLKRSERMGVILNQRHLQLVCRIGAQGHLGGS